MSAVEHGQRLLLVDDREENLVALEAVLRHEGAGIDLARSGPEALELLLRHDYAVALLDVQMPEMDGFELARLMRGAERTRHVPVIFVTAGAFDTERVFRGYEAGAVDFLFKPLDPHVLRSKVSVFLELDARKRELARTARRLADSEALLEGLIENAPLGIAFIDEALRFRRVNRSMAELGGLAPAEHVGRRVGELFPGLPAAELEGLWRRVLETGEPALEAEVSGETRAPGGRRVFRTSVYPVVSGGARSGVGLLLRDVTAEQRAAELQRLLVGIVGHDLRSPLSAVIGSLELLERGGDASARQLRVVARMRTSVDRMAALVRDLLDYTRVRAGGALPLERRPTDLAELVRRVVDEALASHPAAVVSAEGAGPVDGEWDPERLHQLLGNLVANALTHGAQGRPVQVRWRGGENEVEVDVVNEGPPIAPELLPSLFEPLSQGPEGRRDGVGLGLFIAREVARAHGGTVEVRSDGQTVFRVRLPRAAP